MTANTHQIAKWLHAPLKLKFLYFKLIQKFGLGQIENPWALKTTMYYAWKKITGARLEPATVCARVRVVWVVCACMGAEDWKKNHWRAPGACHGMCTRACRVCMNVCACVRVVRPPCNTTVRKSLARSWCLPLTWNLTFVFPLTGWCPSAGRGLYCAAAQHDHAVCLSIHRVRGQAQCGRTFARTSTRFCFFFFFFLLSFVRAIDR